MAETSFIRIRQSASHLTQHEQHQFVQNLKRMKTSGRYDWYVQVHAQVMSKSLAAIPMGNGDRGISNGSSSSISGMTYDTGPMFLAWHRWFLSQFESELGMAIPYWEFTTNGDNTDAAWSVWSDDFMGGDGDACGTVLTGPFAYANGWEIKVGVGTSQPGCQLIRMLGGRITKKPDLPSVTQVSKILAMKSYEEVSKELESLYYYMYGWIGGSVSVETAPNDPIYWLMHSYIDLLWAQWQALYPNSVHFAPASLLNQIMDFGEMRAATPANTINHINLGYTYDKLKANLQKGNNTTPNVAPQDTTSTTKSNPFRKISDRLTRRKAPSPPPQQPRPSSVSPVLPMKPTVAQPLATPVPTAAATVTTPKATVTATTTVTDVPPTRRDFNPRGFQRQLSFTQAQRTPNDSPVPSRIQPQNKSPPMWSHEESNASPSLPVVATTTQRYSPPSHSHQSLDLTDRYIREPLAKQQPQEQKRPFAPRSLPKNPLPYPPSEQQNWHQQHQPATYEQPYPQEVPYVNSNSFPNFHSQTSSQFPTMAPYPLQQQPQQSWQHQQLQQQQYLPYPSEHPQQPPNYYGGVNNSVTGTFSSPQINSFGYSNQQTPYPQQTPSFNPRGTSQQQQQTQNRGYIPADEFFF